MDPWHKVATPRKEVCEGHSYPPENFPRFVTTDDHYQKIPQIMVDYFAAV